MVKRKGPFWLGVVLLLLLPIAFWSYFAGLWHKRPVIRSVSAGEKYSLVLLADGSVWGWGNNSDNQLGTDAPSGVAPAPIGGLQNICAVDAGLSHTVALDATGNVWWWGSNNGFDASYRFTRGDDFYMSSPEPMTIPELTQIVMISAGDHHDLALDERGTVWAWGRNGYGQLGDGTTNAASTPVQVKGLDDVVTVAAGATHSLAVKRDGTVWGWGNNRAKQLGPELPDEILIPSQIEKVENIVQVSGGYGHSVALAKDNRVWVWGIEDRTLLAKPSLRNSDDTPIDEYRAPISFEFNAAVISVRAGSFHTIALLENGQVWAWGSNQAGQLGNKALKCTVNDACGNTANTLLPSDEPIQITELPDIELLAAGNEHNIVVDTAGNLWGWGLDDDYQVGTSSAIELYLNTSFTNMGEWMDYVLEPRTILNNIKMAGPEIPCP